MGVLVEQAQAALAAAAAYETQLRHVLTCRRVEADLAAKVTDLRAAFDRQHADLRADLRRATAEREIAETQARTLADRRAATLGKKGLEWGVVVAEGARLVYDDAKALAWAIARKSCLALDRHAFEEVARHAATNATIRETSGIDFATLEPTRQVRLPNTERLAFLLEQEQREAEAAAQRKADDPIEALFGHVTEPAS